jgi:hypothetical protein
VTQTPIESAESEATPEPDEAAVPGDFSFVMDRQGCLGTCPAYRIELDAVGNLRFQGQGFVSVSGEVRSRIDIERVTELLEMLEAVDYWTRPEESAYEACLAGGGEYGFDAPKVLYEVHAAGRAHRVYADRGCSLPSAQRMYELAERVDALLETAPWIGGREDCRVPELRVLQYDPGAAEPTDPQALQTAVDQIMSWVAAHPGTGLVLQGHASKGESTKMGKRRADALAAHLHNAGLVQSLIEVVDAGRDYPVDSNKTAEGRERNRRIDVMFMVRRCCEEAVLGVGAARPFGLDHCTQLPDGP